MELPEWVVEVAKVGFGATAGVFAGVFAGTKRMDARVRALEERAQLADQHAQTQDATLDELHATVTADHDLLTQANTKLDLIMGAMSLRPKP